ncbi:MAG TPA: hypothetical protein VFV77_07170 [Gammaproteobacteria bacterium]|nr:hypothetical protein [Gammaproteobacteria bacterium]
MKTLLQTMAILTLTMGTAGADTPPALQPALAPLAGFLGTRHCSGSFLKNGKAIGSTESFSADLSGHWLVMRHADEPPLTFDALELWGCNAQKKVFIARIFDNFGGAREFGSSGWDGDRFVWTNLDTNTPKQDHFVFERQPDAGYSFTYAVTADGKIWTDVDSLVCVTPHSASAPA